MEKTQGYIVALSSIGAQLRFPGASDGCISKHAVNRLVEFVVLGEKNPSSYPRSFQVRFRETDGFKKKIAKLLNAEHPSIRAFALAPGQIPTRLATETGAIGDGGVGAPDSIALPAATMLYLTSGRADWLSGRFVYSSSGWLLPTYLFSAFFWTAGFALRTGIWRRWNGIGRT